MPDTNENASGLWQTPVADDSVAREAGKLNGRGEAKLSAQVKLWPTPHGFSKDGKSNGPSGNELGRAVNQSLFPTPTATPYGTNQSPSPGAKVRPSLDTIVRMWPTPSLQEAKNAKNATLPPSQINRDNIPGALMRAGVSGSLNPEFVEWLMGYPIGWTALKGSAIPSSRKSSSRSSTGSGKSKRAK